MAYFLIVILSTVQGCSNKECATWGIRANTEKTDSTHFVLSLFHFNIQYIAGGLTGEGGDTVSNEIMEDLIVRESFEPVLDFYLKHPRWKANIELQGYMLEVMAERHPEVLKKLETLVERGQVELMSFHYSDQLYLAFPREDMEWSWKLNMDLSRELCLPFSDVVFTQEGQFGLGTLDFMAEKGYRIAAFPRGLFRYHYSSDTTFIHPLYQRGNVYVIIAPENLDFEINGTTYSVRWAYYDDGELLATGDIPPYFIIGFKAREENFKEFEERLSAYEAEGYTIATISEYVNTVLDAGVEPRPFPLVFDGDWRPVYSDNLFLWMGGIGLFGGTEMDNVVRVANWKSRRALMKAEQALEYAEASGAAVSEEWKNMLRDAWRHQLKAEVSDSTGWNPAYTEVNYSLYHSAEAEKTAKLLAQKISTMFSESTYQDIRPDLPKYCLEESEFEIASSFPVYSLVTTSRDYALAVSRCTTQQDIYSVTLNVNKGTDREVSVTFPFSLSYVEYSPALLEENLVQFPLGNFDFDHICIPLVNGLIALGENTYLIMDHSTVHLAACVYPAQQQVRIRDETSPEDSFTWRFYIVTSDGYEALRYALRINLYPADDQFMPPP